MNKTAYLLIAALVLNAVVTGNAYDDGDFQLWLKGEVSGKVSDSFSIKIEEEMRYGNDAGELYNEETLILGTHKINDWLKMGIGFRMVQERKEQEVVTPKTTDDGTVSYFPVGDGDHYWQNEECPTGEFVFGKKIAGWGLEDRTRFEWRMKDDGKDDSLRFRNRLKVKSPYKFTALDINPYAAWEVFYEDKDDLSGSDKLDRHRYYLGASASLSERIKCELYYLLQTDRDGDYWKDTNVAGLEIGLSF